MVDNADIGVRAETKGHYGTRIFLCRCAQTWVMHIVRRQYGCAAWSQTFEYLCLCIGNAAFILEKFDMRRGNGRDDGDIGPNNMA